ncbi:hypothetical protein CRE_02200 [Caenorhabditis remanei]|uniref:Uncharacterized protein n=1 Tax=Caenorhabditis remanei TaxID=31234 RepID=E3LFL6_CAERE|nr:hypothetical protein CRE_02200 [Caenorhabditis remanei]
MPLFLVVRSYEGIGPFYEIAWLSKTMACEKKKGKEKALRELKHEINSIRCIRSAANRTIDKKVIVQL